MAWGCEEVGCTSRDHRDCVQQVYYQDGLDREVFLHLVRLPNGNCEVSVNIQTFREYEDNIVVSRTKATALLRKISEFLTKQNENKVRK